MPVCRLRFRKPKVVRFNEENWIEVEFTRDDGVRDRVVFQASHATGWTARNALNTSIAHSVRGSSRRSSGRLLPTNLLEEEPSQP